MPDRALDAPQRVAAEQVVDPLEGDEQLLAAVAKRLPSVVAWAATLWLRPAMTRPACSAARRGQPGERGDHPVADERERRADLQLLDVLGEVARRHALVDVLVAGERGELLDAGLHVVAGDPLAGLDRREVDLVDDRLVGLDHAVGHVDAEVALGPEHGQPQPPLEHDLVLGRPQRDQLWRLA